MAEQSFSLIPFPALDIPEITISGKVSVQGNRLIVDFSLSGDLNNVFLAAESANPSRKDELWKQTCFEFFLACKNQPQYWEFNFSPAGDWNVYRMGAYRRIDFQEEASIQYVRREIHRKSNGFRLSVNVDVNSIVQGNEPIEMNVAAVVQTKDGSETYWALTHPAPHADFHDRRGFILIPVRQTHPSKQSGLVD